MFAADLVQFAGANRLGEKMQSRGLRGSLDAGRDHRFHGLVAAPAFAARHENFIVLEKNGAFAALQTPIPTTRTCYARVRSDRLNKRRECRLPTPSAFSIRVRDRTTTIPDESSRR